MEYLGIAWDSMVWDNTEYNGIQRNNMEQLEIARCSGDQKTRKTAVRAKMALDGQRGHRWGIGKEGLRKAPRNGKKTVGGWGLPKQHLEWNTIA